MHHVFVINPISGKHGSALNLIPEIKEAFINDKTKYDIYITSAPQDAVNYVKKVSEKSANNPTRFYACGGDGTLMEVVNGAYGYANVEVAAIPCGSANDYIRSFETEKEVFMSINNQINGSPIFVDAIDCNGLLSLNICAIGMDADVADQMTKFKNIPFVTGTMAYSLAVIYMFFHKLGRNLHAIIDLHDGTQVEIKGDYLFALAANGKYYGGNHLSSPHAILNDGFLDFQLVETISRPKAISFMSRYKKGQHLDMDIVHLFKGKKMTVTSDKPVTYVVDGECEKTKKVIFEIIPNAIKFVLPVGVKYNA